MQLPMFKTSQPRFATSSDFIVVLASLLCIFATNRFAFAIETNAIVVKDDSHPQLLNLQERQDGAGISKWVGEAGSQSYESTFVGLHRSILGRMPTDPRTMTMNEPSKLNIKGGDTPDPPQYWKLPLSLGKRDLYEASSSDGAKRDDEFQELLKREGKLLYITLSICDQPSPRISSPGGMPPPLQLYISTKIKQPDKDSTDIQFTMDGGFGTETYAATSDVYFSVCATQSTNFSGIYNYELTASVDAPYTSYESTNNLTFLDSDSNSALLVSPNVTTDLSAAPYSIFVYNQDDPAILGIRNSLCGLKNHAQIRRGIPGDPASPDIVTSMTDLSGSISKQYFYVKALNASTNYMATIALERKSNSTVWNSTTFRTKSDQNCAVIYNLEFCTDTAYAVPYNPNRNPNKTDLALKYDNRSKGLYQNFNFSLQQIPCETTLEASYSLVRNCADCDAAYRAWLCAVTIPRCQDASSLDGELQMRNIGQQFWNNMTPTLVPNNTAINSANKMRTRYNSSRNPWIDTELKPGPWNELLPCQELCHELVRSCPAKLGFSCPTERWLKYSYGTVDLTKGRPTCNNPSVMWMQISTGMGLVTNLWLVELAMAAVTMMLHWGL